MIMAISSFRLFKRDFLLFYNNRLIITENQREVLKGKVKTGQRLIDSRPVV